MGRLLLVRLARRPGHRPLVLPGKVRAWQDSLSDCGGSSVRLKLSAVRVDKCIVRLLVQLSTPCCTIIQAPPLVTFVVTGSAGTH